MSISGEDSYREDPASGLVRQATIQSVNNDGSCSSFLLAQPQAAGECGRTAAKLEQPCSAAPTFGRSQVLVTLK